MERPLTLCVDITQELGLPCNPKTMRRHLNECGLRCSIPARKETLTRAIRNPDWNSSGVIARMCMMRTFGTLLSGRVKNHFRQLPQRAMFIGDSNTRYAASNIQELKRSGCLNVNFHGWMWSGGLGDLTWIKGNLNSAKYIQVLETIIPSNPARAILAPTPIRFVHDRSPIHTNRLVRN